VRRAVVFGALAGAAGAAATVAPLLLAAGLVACGSTNLDAIANAPPQASPEAGVTDAAALDGRGSSEGGADARAAVAGCKRGIAANAAPSAAFAPGPTGPGIAWWYNWASQPAPGGAPGIEFVPMVWGGGSLAQTAPAGSKTLLGFNEPNFKSQADMTSAQAAADWPAVEAIAAPGHLAIASPGVNYCGSATDSSQCTEPAVTDPYAYLTEFFGACSGCKVDYVAVHAYECDAASLRNYIEGSSDAGATPPGFVKFGRPIWVTELACDATHSVADQKVFMLAAVPYLESNPDVVRYAWFNADPIPTARLTDADGGLTELGSTYLGLPASCP
jgi:hypothetical protein